MKIPRSILSSLFMLSLAAFFFGLFLHGWIYFGVDPRHTNPTIWFSFQLITALAVVPAVISFRKRDASRGSQVVNTTQSRDRFHSVLGGVALISLLYAVFIFLFMGTGHLYSETGFSEAMQRSGHSITQADIITYSIRWSRMSSSHWMVIWSFIAAELYAGLLAGSTTRLPD
jgi:hypothetical protein